MFLALNDQLPASMRHLNLFGDMRPIEAMFSFPFSPPDTTTWPSLPPSCHAPCHSGFSTKMERKFIVNGDMSCPYEYDIFNPPNEIMTPLSDQVCGMEVNMYNHYTSIILPYYNEPFYFSRMHLFVFIPSV